MQLSNLVINIFLDYQKDNQVLEITNISFILASACVSALIIAYYRALIIKKEDNSILLHSLVEEKNSRIKKESERFELKFKAIIEHGFDGITIVDEHGNNKFISNSSEKITGYNSEEFNEGALSFEKIHPEDMPRVVENFRNITEQRINHSTIYYRYKHKDDSWRNLEVSITNLLDNPGIEGILFVYRDVTKHIKAEKRARYLEYYDQLTDLPNQIMFSEKIAEEIERSSARNRSFAVMCLGIDYFKNINSEYGTTFGDSVLQHIGARLKGHFRGDDFVSRMMGDKFLILFSDMKSENDVISIVQKTMSSFESSFTIDEREIQISASIGISIYPQDGEKKDELIKNSETALFICKEKREQSYSLYNKILNDDIIHRILIEKEIYKAIENKDFTVFYQPKVNHSGVIKGAEALIRWSTEDRGMVPPGIFIPISEGNRSIIAIGKIVIEKTFNHITQWNETGFHPLKISINVSPLQFSDPEFISSLIHLQKKYSINPQFIEFEITETGIMENEVRTVEIMTELTSLGYSISIDDFGTGYSSLNKLKDYPVHTLKIDKSFIDSIPENSSSCNIVKTIIDLAHYLDYSVVAEGVEELKQVKFLNEYKCDLIQGYYYHKPMAEDQFKKLLIKV